MSTLSAPLDTARLAFTLELTGWERYPVDEHCEFMTGRSPDERTVAPSRQYSHEWIKYRVALEVLDQTILEGHGALDTNYDWPPLLKELEGLVAGRQMTGDHLAHPCCRAG